MSDLETASNLLRRIYDEEFGFLPTNVSIHGGEPRSGRCRGCPGVSGECLVDGVDGA
jgi:hypothetical protein